MPYVAPEDWKPRGIEDLEPNAWTALRTSGNLAVVAGPGAGKTEFLAQRAAFLLETGICPAPYRRRMLRWCLAWSKPNQTFELTG